MADKLRTTYPHALIFGEGEQPIAEKFTALSTQAKTGLGIVEKAIGDIWGTGGDANVSGLQIPNLGRIIGENKWLNPALFSLTQPFYYIEKLDVEHNLRGKGYLTFKPFEKNGNYNIVVADQSTTWGTSKSTELEVTTPTDYWIDTAEGTGRFKFGAPFSSGTAIFVGYWVNPLDWDFGKEDIVPGVIPDSRSLGDIWLDPPAASSVSGEFLITLPFRLPLNTLSSHVLPDRIPVPCEHASGDLNTEEGSALHNAFDSSFLRLWAASGTTENGFHKYRIPQLSTLGNGDPIPDGTLHLCYGNDYRVIDGLTFKRGSNEWSIVAVDTAGQLQAKITEIENGATAKNFSVICSGAPVSKSIWALTNAFANHTHEGSHGERIVEHSKIDGLAPLRNRDDMVWKPSSLPQDDHIQYLHRDATTQRDPNKGAMLTDLLISENTLDGDDYLGNLSIYPSNRIYFGDNSVNNPCIYAPAGSGGSIAIQAFAPKLDFRDATTPANWQSTDFRIQGDGGSLTFKGDSAQDGTYSQDYFRLMCGVTNDTDYARTEFKTPITWDSGTTVLMHGPNTTSDGDSPMYSDGGVINTDGFRIKYENQPYFDSSGGDWLYFERTESSAVHGDGGIAFGVRHIQDSSGYTNHATLLLNGKRQVIVNGFADGNPQDARFMINSMAGENGIKVKGEANNNPWNGNVALINAQQWVSAASNPDGGNDFINCRVGAPPSTSHAMSVKADGTMYSMAHIPKQDLVYHYSAAAHTLRNSIVAFCRVVPTIDGNGDFLEWTLDSPKAWNVRAATGSNRSNPLITLYHSVSMHVTALVDVQPSGASLGHVYDGSLFSIGDPAVVDWDSQTVSIQITELRPDPMVVIVPNPAYSTSTNNHTGQTQGNGQPVTLEQSITPYVRVPNGTPSSEAPLPQAIWITLIGHSDHHMLDNTGEENGGNPSGMPFIPLPDSVLELSAASAGLLNDASAASLGHESTITSAANAELTSLAGHSGNSLMTEINNIAAAQTTILAQQNTIIQNQALAEFEAAGGSGAYANVGEFINSSSTSSFTEMAVNSGSFTSFDAGVAFNNDFLTNIVIF